MSSNVNISRCKHPSARASERVPFKIPSITAVLEAQCNPVPMAAKLERKDPVCGEFPPMRHTPSALLDETSKPTSLPSITDQPGYIVSHIPEPLSEEEEYPNEEVRQDLLLRFVFDREITMPMAKEFDIHLQRLVSEGDIKAKTVSWEGINKPPSLQIKDIMIAQRGISGIFHFINSLHRIRKNRLDASPTEEALLPPASASELLSLEATQRPIPSGPPSVDGSFVTTPDPKTLEAEPEIGDDEGASSSKKLFSDTGRCDVSSSPHSNDRRGRGSAHTPVNATLKSCKRDRSIHDDNPRPGKLSRKNTKCDSARE